MQFAKVVEVYDKIEATTKRLEMTDLLVRLLRLTPLEDLDKVVYLTQGRIHPDYMGIELGLAEKMVLRVLMHATGLDESKVNRMWKDQGDLGLVAEDAISGRRQKPLESSPLTVAKVYGHRDAAGGEVHRTDGRRQDAARRRGHDDRRRPGPHLRDEGGSRPRGTGLQ